MKKFEHFKSNLKVLVTAENEDLSNEFIVGGIIDKFFVQFELGWKVLKELLSYEGQSISATGSPKMILKTAYTIFDFIDEDIWLVLKTFSENEADKQEISNNDFLQMFLDAKRIEGCSERTIQYYRVTVEHLFSKMNQSVRRITTEEIRTYLSDYQKINRCSNVTIDNIRRNISSFFSWLEEEDYILKSPMKRIHKIKTKTVVKSVITDEGIEKLRDNCAEIRDLAIIDLLYSTGIRVGELVNLNIEDIDLEGRECIVYGKGDKERRVYFDAKAKVHLKEYIEKRKDNSEALFVTLDAPHDRLKISGVEIRLRQLGRQLKLDRIHPHKFRRTMATRAIDKGMPIEQVQKILGHSQIDTTMQYAMVNQNNVKTSHQKYMS